MTFQPGANLYTQGFGSRPETVEVPLLSNRNPSVGDVNYPIGKRWLNTVTEQESILYSFNTANGVTIANWSSPLGPSGAVDTISDGTTKVSPDVTGNIAITGTTNEVTITSNPGSHFLHASFPNTMITPGSLEVSNGFSVSGGAVDIQTGTNHINIGTLSTGDISIGQSTGSQAVNIDSGSGGILLEVPNSGLISINPTNSSFVHVGNSNTNEIDMGAQIIHFNSFSGSGIGINNGSISPVNIGGAGGVLNINSTTKLGNALFLNNTFVVGPTYTLQPSDCFLNCNTTSAITINLVTLSGFGQVLVIADTTGLAGGNNITINAPVGGNINVKGMPAGSTYVINQNFGSVTMIVSSGAEYFVVSQGG